MALSSLLYFVFLTGCVALFHVTPLRFKSHLLLVASVAFYLYAMPALALWMMLYALFIWCAGFLARPGKRAGIVFAAFGIILSIAVLLLVKYAVPVLRIFPGNLAEASFFRKLAAPMGISYVSFQGISYLADIAGGKIRPEHNAVRFFLYLLFFAKITAGPIEEPAVFLEQLKGNLRVTERQSAQGLLLIMRGMLRKVALSDAIAPGVDAVFANPSAQSGFAVLLGVCLYSFQIYYDFAGYTDIARGSALLFGIRLSENFRKPYTAETIRDFWNRWHISLSRWLRDHVYIPLGGSRCSLFRRCLNIILTFLVSGIWHGASLTFVVWGLLHGLFQAGGILLDTLRGKESGRKKKKSAAYRLFCMFRTFLIASFCWIFFRADTLSDAWMILTRPFTGMGSFLQALEITGITPYLLLLFLGVLLAIRAMDTALIEPLSNDAVRGIPATRRIAFLAVITVWVVFFVQSTLKGTNSFIYFHF